MSPVIATFLGVLSVSAMAFAGIALFTLHENLVRRLLPYLVSCSTGILLGNVFMHILPELAEDGRLDERTTLIILWGILASFAIEKVIRWKHCHIFPSAEHHHPMGTMTMVADAIHNGIDGMLIAAAFLTDSRVGVATTIAIALHEIPQEIGDIAVLLFSGFRRMTAMLWNAASALGAFTGAVLVLLTGGMLQTLVPFLLAFAAGNFLYIAGTDLLPELHRETRASRAMLQLACMAAGIGLMQALTMWE